MGFAQGVSGLSASASNLDVIGNNIANSGTAGFKAGSAQFSEVYAGTTSLGTQVSAVVQNFAAGAVQSSTRPLDVAIVNGDGFFRLTSPSGEIAYSRNGQFNKDKDGFIVNSAGMQLTGYQVDASGAISGGSPSALQLPTTAMVPRATQVIAAQFNVDSRSLPPTATPFNANNSTTYNYANALTVFDSLGNPHELSTFFVKTGVDAWSVYATADGYPLTAAGAMVAPPTAAGPPAIANSVALSDGGVGFNGSGNLISGPPTTLVNGKMSLTGLDFANGANPMTLTIDVTGTTQFGNTNEVNKLTQDGYTSGQLTSYAIGQDGVLTGKYSNEQSKLLGQIVLSSFVNPNGLKPKGDNVWAETSASGQPLTGTPGTGAKAGALTGSALEGSNVDLTSELVNLIIAQRTYQANAQTVKTQDQVTQTLINMR